MLGVTSRPINAGRKKKVPSQFALHPPLALAKRQSCNLCVLGRYNTLYILVHMICIHICIICYHYLTLVSKRQMHLQQTLKDILVNFFLCASWIAHLQRSKVKGNMTNGVLSKRCLNQSKEHWRREAREWWKFEKNRGSKEENRMRTSYCRGKLEWNLVLCGSLSVDLSFLNRGLVLHGSKSVSCAIPFSAYCGNCWPALYDILFQVGSCQNFGRSYRADLMISALQSVLSGSIQWKPGTGIERLWVNSPEQLL